MRTEKGMENAKAARAAYNRENYKTLGVNLRKEDAEAFRLLAERKGTTPGALLKQFILGTISGEHISSGARDFSHTPPETAILTPRNFERLKHETAFYNPRNLDPNGLLNHILSSYFKMADEIRTKG